MTRVTHIQRNATGGKTLETGHIHHSQILQCSVFDVQCSVLFPSQLATIQDSRNHNNFEDNRYIYHSDHLGSSAFLTDANGTPTQHLQYLPFGEPFIEQRSVTDYYTPYTFSAKERDLETGYSYFGARYYDANISVWLSVDPKTSDFPEWSAYNYCEQNPVKYIDPTGKNPIGALIGAVGGAAKNLASQTISNGFDNLGKGKGFFNGWSSSIDWADVAISAGEGALAGATMGISLIATSVGGAILRSAVDWKGEDSKPKFVGASGEWKKNTSDVVYDVLSEGAGIGLGKIVGKQIGLKNQITNLKNLSQQITKTTVETASRMPVDAVGGRYRQEFVRLWGKIFKPNIKPLPLQGITPYPNNENFYQFLPEN